MNRYNQSSLFRRLMTGFALVLLTVALGGLAYVFYEAKATQRMRTASENAAHAREVMMHMAEIAESPDRMRAAAARLEEVRAAMFKDLDYHSRVRLRIFRNGELLYNSLPALPASLPSYTARKVDGANGWVQWIERDDKAGLVVERSHEVDDEWMLSISGVSFLMSSTVFSLPLLLLPAWLIVGIGLRPLRSIAEVIEQRDDFDLTALPESKYRELTPLVTAINRLLARLSYRIAREHDFVTDAAHELKTPLAAIQINAHVLLSRCDDETRQRCAGAVEGLHNGVNRATHMVHQLLALERANAEASSEPPQDTELGAFIRDRMADVAPMALERDIDIEFQAEAQCVLPIHVESMAALLDNLIGNAIKYSDAHGRVMVRLDGCILTIADQGPGIDPALHEKVFERFYRVPGQNESGSGLGLSIAASAAVRNNATIALASGSDGKGLVVTVSFAGTAP